MATVKLTVFTFFRTFKSPVTRMLPAETVVTLAAEAVSVPTVTSVALRAPVRNEPVVMESVNRAVPDTSRLC